MLGAGVSILRREPFGTQPFCSSVCLSLWLVDQSLVQRLHVLSGFFCYQISDFCQNRADTDGEFQADNHTEYRTNTDAEYQTITELRANIELN